jgi:hypothetical protein
MEVHKSADIPAQWHRRADENLDVWVHVSGDSREMAIEVGRDYANDVMISKEPNDSFVNRLWAGNRIVDDGTRARLHIDTLRFEPSQKCV